MIFQPILSQDSSGDAVGLDEEMVDHVDRNAWPHRQRLGPLFRQFAADTIQINSGDPDIEFDEVSLADARRAVDISTQAYTLLVDSLDREPSHYEDGSVFDRAHMKETARYNTRVAKYMRQLPKEKYEELRGQFSARLRERLNSGRTEKKN